MRLACIKERDGETMIDGKRVLGLIPARGGSKGIKNKNITEVNGVPLIGYTIMEAGKSRYLDDVVVTTDSERIKSIAEAYGAQVPFLRPGELAGDRTPTLDAVLHAVRSLENMGRSYDIVVLLQATSPLRTSGDIDHAMELFIEKKGQGVAAVSEVSDPPVLMRILEEGGHLSKWLDQGSTIRRQDMPKTYRINGSIYINPVSEIKEGLSFNDNPVGYVMERSHSVDVDEESDLWLAGYYLGKNGVGKNGRSQ